MKALLIAENWPPRMGGIERYLYNLASRLTGLELKVIAPLTGDTSGHDSAKVKRLRFFYPFFFPAWLPLFVRVLRLIRSNKVDVLLCGKALFEGQMAYYVKKLTGLPYVVFTYAMEIETWQANGYTRRRLKKVLSNADRIVYINEHIKNRLIALGVDKAKLVKIHPGVNEVFYVGNISVLAKYGIRQPYIVTASRHVPRKGIDDLIMGFANAAAKADHSLVIVGDGPERIRLQQLARTLRLGSRVIFIGQVSDDDLAGILTGAKIFALTPKQLGSDVEGFGIVYLEAAAAGRPTIGTRTGGVPEAIEENITGLLVSPGSPAEISKAIDRLTSDTAAAERMGQAGRERARREFSWPKQAGLLMNEINKINDYGQK